MYTKLDDQRQANFIIKYIQEHPNCSIKNIVQDCVVSRTRLHNLEKQRYFTLPKPKNDKEYTNDLINSINLFINSSECKSHRNIRAKFNIRYDALKKLEHNGMITWKN